MRTRCGFPGQYHEDRLTPEQVNGVLEQARIPALLRASFVTALEEWRLRWASSHPPHRLEANRVNKLGRIVLDIDDPVLAALSWESLLTEILPSSLSDISIVRTTAVEPHFASIPITFPMRILQFSPGTGHNLKGMIRDALGGGISDEEAAQAIEVYDFAVSDMKGWAAPHGEPTAEVLHFTEPSWMAQPEKLLSTAVPDQPGTLGWLSRVAELGQTRLVVIDCAGTETAQYARRLALRLVNRGGPAVLVTNFAAEAAAGDFYKWFYHQVIHDFPLDVIFKWALSWFPNQMSFLNGLPSLFVGAGREEGLRISTVGVNLLQLEQDLLFAATEGIERESVTAVRELVSRTHEARIVEDLGKPIAYDWAAGVVTTCVAEFSYRAEHEVTRDMKLGDLGISTRKELKRLAASINNISERNAIRLVGWRRELSDNLSSERRVGEIIDTLVERGRLIPYEALESNEPVVLRALESDLHELRNQWTYIKFDDSERKGFIPLWRSFNTVRDHVGLRGTTTARHVAPTVTGPRYVNSSLWSAAEDKSLQQLERESALLRVDETYHLGIQIGQEDVRYRAVGASAVFEELFKWTKEMKGVWLEIGVSGIDFEVLGEPVQELWLPQATPSDFIYFAVSPHIAGAARLRFCIYYKQNLIQSFRLAALTTEPGHEDTPAEERRRLLASALDVTEETTRDVGYLTRLEYSLTSSADGIETRPARDLSIAANDLNGLTVITVKGPDEFRVILPGNLHVLVSEVRKTLKEVSANPKPGEPDPAKWNYAFGPYPQPDALQNALRRMARVGWYLYDQMFQGDDQKNLDKLLSEEGRVISVAHLLRDRVIPWAALYDRPYEPDTKDVAVGTELRQTVEDVCLVSLPNPDGSLPVSECGKHKDCPLHEDRKREYEKMGKAALKETIVCPLRFWGFRHVIEIPPQQVAAGDDARPQWDRILGAGGRPQLAAAYNGSLLLWDNHWKDVQKLAPWKTKTDAKRRALILQALQNAELDIIYFYCHARGGVDDALENPEHLVFQAGPQAEIEKLTASGFLNLPKWSHHPLVILNGCGTVGFSPDALSPFLKKLVDDLGAAGVLGTEVTVWEELATQAAKYFLERFLAGKSAGEALLTMRRILLANRNPLGLVYTLYAPAHLVLDKENGRRTVIL